MMPARTLRIYGLEVPADAPRIAVELQAYRERLGPEVGALGPAAHFRNAFLLMWPKYEMSRWVEELIDAYCSTNCLVVIGHQRASKSYTLAHLLYLDYCADPNRTLTSIATVTFEGLKLRMWSDLLKAIETASIPFPMAVRSSTNELRIYPAEAKSESTEKFQIHGMAINNNKDAEGRIRGGHAPRRRIVLDEAQDIAAPIYEAMVNPMSAPDAKCVLLSNPVEKLSKFGEWCEPEGGWGSVTENDLKWRTKKGGICLHFDGLKSPAVLEPKKRWTGLLTAENIEQVKQAHGEDSTQWWALIRGWFPPDGLVARVFPSGTIEKGKPSLAFDFRPRPCASLDPAFEHDNCVLHFGNWGKLRDGRDAITGTESVVIKPVVGAGQDPKDYQVARGVKRECLARGVAPADFIMDKSGGGRGVFAILQVEWSPQVQGVEYGGACTVRPIVHGGSPANEGFRFFVSELWFRARYLIESGQLAGLSLLHPSTIEDLTARRYELVSVTQGKVQQVEKKEDMKKRLGRSPDFGDALVQFGELLARKGATAGIGSNPNAARQKWDGLRKRAIAVNSRGAEPTFSH